jgi:hypothetical protein
VLVALSQVLSMFATSCRLVQGSRFAGVWPAPVVRPARSLTTCHHGAQQSYGSSSPMAPIISTLSTTCFFMYSCHLSLLIAGIRSIQLRDGAARESEVMRDKHSSKKESGFSQTKKHTLRKRTRP